MLSQEEEKHGSVSEADILVKLTETIRPACDICEARVGTVWYKEKIEDHRKESKSINNGSEQISTPRFTICQLCYQTGKYPSLYLKSDFKKVTLVNKLDKKGVIAYGWTQAKSLELLRTIKECSFNWNQIEEKYPELDAYSIAKIVLQLPFKHFKNINKLSVKNFETVFKDKENSTQFDTTNANPLIEHVS